MHAPSLCTDLCDYSRDRTVMHLGFTGSLWIQILDWEAFTRPFVPKGNVFLPHSSDILGYDYK